MGRTYISYTKERQYSTFYIWFQRSKQTYLTSAISHTKNPRSLVETWRIPLWNHTRFKYEILSYWTQCQVIRTLHNCHPMGQVWVSTTSDGAVQQSWHLPGEDVWPLHWSKHSACLHRWPFACYKTLLDRTSFYPRYVKPLPEGWSQGQRQQILLRRT